MHYHAGQAATIPSNCVPKVELKLADNVEPAVVVFDTTQELIPRILNQSGEANKSQKENVGESEQESLSCFEVFDWLGNEISQTSPLLPPIYLLLLYYLWVILICIHIYTACCWRVSLVDYVLFWVDGDTGWWLCQLLSTFLLIIVVEVEVGERILVQTNLSHDASNENKHAKSEHRQGREEGSLRAAISRPNQKSSCSQNVWPYPRNAVAKHNGSHVFEGEFGAHRKDGHLGNATSHPKNSQRNYGAVIARTVPNIG